MNKISEILGHSAVLERILERLIENLLSHAVSVLVIFMVVIISSKLIHVISNEVIRLASRKRSAVGHAHDQEKRIATVARLLGTTLRVMLYAAGLLMVLKEFGIDITPLLTGAGIAGVALGLGAQSLVKDVIAGFFLLLENQIRVGDVVRIAGLSGKVERMELRITVLRDGDGTLHVVPNSEIKTVSNMTYEYSVALVDLFLPYSANLTQAMQVLSEVGAEFSEDPEWMPHLRGKVELLSLAGFEPTVMKVQVKVKTEAESRWSVSRELRRRIRVGFEKADIPMSKTPA